MTDIATRVQRFYNDTPFPDFGEATGVPALLNTSFNLRGEPMVASPADAWKAFSESGLDVLVRDRFVVRK